MPARQGRETRLARLINHRTTTMETQERAHLVIDAGGQPQRRIHIHQRQQQRDHRRRHPRRHPAIRLISSTRPDAPAPPAPPGTPPAPRPPDPQTRLRRPPGQRRTQCVCMHVHFHSRFRSNHPPCDPNPQIRKAASIPAPPHKRRKPATAVPAGRADPAPPVRSRRPWRRRRFGIYPAHHGEELPPARRHLRLPRHAFLAATRQRCDQLPLHGLMPFRQLQQRVGHGGCSA